MKGLFQLLRRFLIPYKGWAFSNILFNILGAIFGAFSFLALSPVLGILFGMQDTVTDKVEFSLNFSDIKHNLYYYMSSIIVESGHMGALYLIGIFMIIMVFLKVGFTYLASFSMVPLRNGVVRDLRNQIYAKLISLPIGYYTEERKGDIMARVTGDVSEVENSIMNSLEMFFKNPILIVISLIVMVYMSWSLTLFVLLMLPIAIFVTGRIGRSLKKPSRKGQNKMGEVLSTIDETLSGLTIIKAFNAEKRMSKRFQTETNDYYKTMNRLMWRSFLAHPVSEFMGTTIIIFVLWYGGNLILKNEGTLDPEDFITYLVFFYSIINPAKAFSTAFYSVQKGLAAMDRVDQILNTSNPIVDRENARSKNEFNHEIEFRNVSFGYGNNKVLKNIDLIIPKGKTVALVGKSGSGKTTLVNLLPRFWDIQNGGEILIDGINIKDIRIHDLRAVLVPQPRRQIAGVWPRRFAAVVDDLIDEKHAQRALPDPEGVSILEPLLALDQSAVQEAAVAAHELLDEDAVLAEVDPKMSPRDEGVVESQRTADVATHDRLAGRQLHATFAILEKEPHRPTRCRTSSPLPRVESWGVESMGRRSTRPAASRPKSRWVYKEP